MEPTVLFKESTKPYKVIILPFIISYLFLFYGVLRQLIYDIPLGTKPISDGHLIIFTICCGIFIALLGSIRAELKVTNEGFFLKTVPFISADLTRWSSVDKMEVANYNHIKESVGLGFRGISTQMAYLGGGQPGIKLYFHNGDKILLAARNQEKLLHVLSDLALITADKK